MEWLHEINICSVMVRLLLAVLFGGIVGLERGANKHQAGLRTHILVCMGATLAMMTNNYIFETITDGTDPARLGAQVISGIGFLGAGLILVTSRKKVKGLTTAAGLWASACMGLALGIGFYSGAFIAGILIFIVLALLPKLEIYFYNRSKIINLYVELDSIGNMKGLLSCIRKGGYMILETHINKSDSLDPDGYSLNLSMRIPKKISQSKAVEILSEQPGVLLVEELD